MPCWSNLRSSRAAVVEGADAVVFAEVSAVVLFVFDDAAWALGDTAHRAHRIATADNFHMEPLRFCSACFIFGTRGRVESMPATPFPHRLTRL